MALLAFSVSNVAAAGGLLLAATALWYLYRGYCVRSRFQRLQKQGVPMLPHHPVLGHLAVVGEIMKDMPADAHGDYMMVLIQENWRQFFPASYERCPPAVYLDLWPVSPPMLLALDPAVSAQFTQDFNLGKAEQTIHFLRPLTDNLDVSSSNGTVWKLRRRRLTPGFSPQNLNLCVPSLLEEVEVFVDVLRGMAGDPDGSWGPVFQLEEKATMLTLDFIGRFTLDVRLHEQTSPLTPFSAGLLETLPLLTIHVHIGNFLSIYNPWRFYRIWRSRRKMDAYLLPLLRARIAALEQENDEEKSATTKKRPLIDSLVRTMADDREDEATFLPYALAETKHTMFAGHETTAFTLAWIFLMLSRHPETLERMRAEHDAVLGSVGDTPANLRAAPHLLNQLVYTNAVIRETLRVHSNVGTLRAGNADFNLYGPAGSGYEGVVFPTEGCVLWDGNFAMHRNPELWPRPAEFVPERFLTTDPNDPLHPPTGPRGKAAYRPFVQGPRTCVGQHLAMLEMKMVLALVARTLDLEAAWDEWDALKGNTKRPTVWGERLYQVSKGGPPHVKDGMPVRVRLRQ